MIMHTGIRHHQRPQIPRLNANMENPFERIHRNFQF